MPRMPKKRKLELSFFLNERGAGNVQRPLPEMPTHLQAEFPGGHCGLPPLSFQTLKTKSKGGHRVNGS